MIDNGSGVNLIHTRVVKQNNLKLFKHHLNISISGYGGTPATPEFVAEVPLIVGTESIDIYAFMSDSVLLTSYDIIVGTSVIGRKIGLEMSLGGSPTLLIPSVRSSEVARVACQPCLSRFPDLEKRNSVSSIQPQDMEVESALETCSCLKSISKAIPSILESVTTTGCNAPGKDSVAAIGEVVGPTRSSSGHQNEKAPIAAIDERSRAVLMKRQISAVTTTVDKSTGRKRRKLLKKRANTNEEEFRKSDRTKSRKRRKRLDAAERKERKERQAKIDELFKSANKYTFDKMSHKEMKQIDMIAAAIETEQLIASEKSKDTNRRVELVAALDIHEDDQQSKTIIDITHEVAAEIRQEFVAGIDVVATPAQKLDKYEFEPMGNPKKENLQDIKYLDLDKRQKIILSELLNEFSDIIVEDESKIRFGEARVPRFDIELREGAAEVLERKKRRPYGIKGDLASKLKENYNTMEQNGIGARTRPGDEVAYASPGFYVYNERAAKIIPLSR